MTSKQHLRIDSHVVVQLGAELITDSEQALLELVKNAYDADASRCVIQLEPEWVPEDDDEWSKHLYAWQAARKRDSIGRIGVLDDGTGVDEAGIENGWLLISASLKRGSDGEKRPTEERNRVPVGDKGLGRLATMRLGEVLRMQTMTKGEHRSRSVSFAWSSFKPGAALEDIEVKTTRKEKLKGRTRGSNVEILGLTEPEYWTSEANISAMLSKLSSLISPFKRFKDFQVTVRALGQEYDLQGISAEALNFAAAKFSFEFDGKALHLRAHVAKSLFRGATGEANRRLYDELFSEKNLPNVISFLGNHPRVSGRNFRTLNGEPGGWLFSVEDSIPIEDVPSDPKLLGASDPGPFRGEIFYFLFNDQTREQLVAANVPLELLQGMTTIGMFRDGFRVRMSDDWLELAKGSTTGGFFQLRPRNVIGYFEIDNKHNPRLVEKSDREGFVDNDSWRGFMLLANRTKKFANDTLDAVRTAYDEYKRTVAGRDAPAVVPVEERHNHIAVQQDRAQRSLQSLLEKSEVLSERVNDARRTVSKLQRSPQRATIEKQLIQIEEGLEEVRSKVEIADSATRSGFIVAGGLADAQSQLEERNLRLLEAASVGLSARALVHEMHSHLTHLGRAISAISKENRAEPNEKIGKAVTAMTDVVRELKKVVATIEPLAPASRTLKDTFEVTAAIKEFVEQRSARLEAAKVDFEIESNTHLQIRFSRARFAQILENLLQNSLYWIGEHGAELGKASQTIRVQIDDAGFNWSDSGKGVRPALEDSLFDAYVSDKPLNRGQGLGLFIVTSFLQAERCSIGLLHERNRFRRRYIFRVDLSGAKRR